MIEDPDAMIVYVVIRDCRAVIEDCDNYSVKNHGAVIEDQDVVIDYQGALIED